MKMLVYIDAAGLTEGVLFMGTLEMDNVRGKEIFSFLADEEWIQNKSFTYIDANLGQYTGNQYVPAWKDNFGIFTDSCPDRWGVSSCSDGKD